MKKIKWTLYIFIMRNYFKCYSIILSFIEDVIYENKDKLGINHTLKGYVSIPRKHNTRQWVRNKKSVLNVVKEAHSS